MAPLKPFNLILVDDDPDEHNLVMEALELIGCGCNISFFRNASSFLSFLENASEIPDALIIEENMPIINGLDAVLDIRGQDRFLEMSIYVYSSFSDPKVFGAVSNIKNCSYVIKPLTFESLADLLKKIVEGKQAF